MSAGEIVLSLSLLCEWVCGTGRGSHGWTVEGRRGGLDERKRDGRIWGLLISSGDANVFKEGFRIAGQSQSQALVMLRKKQSPNYRSKHQLPPFNLFSLFSLFFIFLFLLISTPFPHFQLTATSPNTVSTENNLSGQKNATIMRSPWSSNSFAG